MVRRASPSDRLPGGGAVLHRTDADATLRKPRVQTELLNRKRWNTRVESASAMFEYVDVFHNRQRRHSSIGMLIPIEYEKIHHTGTA